DQWVDDVAEKPHPACGLHCDHAASCLCDGGGGWLSARHPAAQHHRASDDRCHAAEHPRAVAAGGAVCRCAARGRARDRLTMRPDASAAWLSIREGYGDPNFPYWTAARAV